MKKEKIHDDGLYIKLPGVLKRKASQYAAEHNIPGGLSEMVRSFLEKKTKKIIEKA
jgi:hypothetical protein